MATLPSPPSQRLADKSTCNHGVSFDETLEKACGKDVVGFAIQRALLDVGHFGIQRGFVILVQRKGAQAFAALLADADRALHQFIAIAQHALNSARPMPSPCCR